MAEPVWTKIDDNKYILKVESGWLYYAEEGEGFCRFIPEPEKCPKHNVMMHRVCTSCINEIGDTNKWMKNN